MSVAFARVRLDDAVIQFRHDRDYKKAVDQFEAAIRAEERAVVLDVLTLDNYTPSTWPTIQLLIKFFRERWTRGHARFKGPR